VPPRGNKSHAFLFSFSASNMRNGQLGLAAISGSSRQSWRRRVRAVEILHDGVDAEIGGSVQVVL